MEDVIIGDPTALLRTLAVGIAAYAALVLMLRLSGKRTLSKLNAFDLVVTVALGSTLSSILLDKTVSLAQGVLAFATLIALQFVVTWSSIRYRPLRGIVTGEPTLVFFRGEYLPASLRRVRMTEAEIEASIRSAGVAALSDVEAVVLETDGSLSVVRRGSGTGRSTLDELPHRR